MENQNLQSRVSIWDHLDPFSSSIASCRFKLRLCCGTAKSDVPPLGWLLHLRVPSALAQSLSQPSAPPALSPQRSEPCPNTPRASESTRVARSHKTLSVGFAGSCQNPGTNGSSFRNL